MQQVVDASVVAKWFLPEAHKDKAEKLLRDFLDEKIELTGPELLAVEVGNLVWKRSMKLKQISAAQADQIYGDFLALRLPLRHSPSIVAAALKLATQNDHPIYDMLYIALAEQSTCQFVTADEKLVKKFASTFGCLRWIGDL
jgi:predicted nucleic acid-binding protein